MSFVRPGHLKRRGGGAYNSALAGTKWRRRPYVDICRDGNLEEGILAFTRSSSGTYITSAGLVATASSGAARKDYNSSGTLLGALFEAAATNQVLWNRDLTNAAWVKTSCTAAKDQTGADGVANSASSLTATAGNATCLQAITLASSSRRQSAYVKRITGSGVINMTTDNGVTWTPVTVTAGWTQVSIAAQTLANPTVGFQIVTSGDAIAVDYVQNETGPIVTSVIATTTAAVTRAADAGAITNLALVNYNQAEGTMYVEGLIPAGATSTIDLCAFSDNTVNEWICPAFTNGAVAMALRIQDGGAGQVLAGRAYTLGNAFKQASAWKVNDSACSFNGQAAVTDTVCTMPTVDRFNIGSSVPALGGTTQRAWFKNIRYWPTRKADAVLVTLTT